MSKRGRELVDSGEVFDELPDAPATTLGPFRSPARAHDHRLSPRLPTGYTVGQAPHVHAARHRGEAAAPILSGEAASFGADPGDEVSRPADAAEALQWFEPVRVREAFELPGGRVSPELGTSLEVARVDLPSWRLAVVERIATYLRLQALDAAGEPTGSPFITTGDGAYDPFPAFIHPVTLEPLDLRWSLLGVARARASFDGAPIAGLAGQPIQLEQTWADLRFGWGQRYTQGLQLEVPSGVTSVRLVATAASDPVSRWSVVVGGRLGGWLLAGGPRGAALRAATSRVGGGA